MRHITMEEDLYNWFGKIMETEEMQAKLIHYETPSGEEMTKLYETFHKRKEKKAPMTCDVFNKSINEFRGHPILYNRLIYKHRKEQKCDCGKTINVEAE